MKQKAIDSYSYFRTSRLALLALACITVISLAACSSDDGETKAPSPLDGEWVYERKDYSEQYTFYYDGRGIFSNSAGTWGDFTYKILDGGGLAGSVHVKETLWRDGYVWNDEYSCTYKIEGDVLKFKSRMYRRRL